MEARAHEIEYIRSYHRESPKCEHIQWLQTEGRICKRDAIALWIKYVDGHPCLEYACKFHDDIWQKINTGPLYKRLTVAEVDVLMVMEA